MEFGQERHHTRAITIECEYGDLFPGVDRTGPSRRSDRPAEVARLGRPGAYQYGRVFDPLSASVRS